MAQIELASLVAKLKLDAKQYRSELAGTENANKRFRVGMAAVGAAAAAAAIVLAGKAVKAAQEWGGEVRVLTRELGVSAEEASGLAHAAEHLGIPVESLSRGFGIFAKNIVIGNKALAANGIQTRDAQGRTLSFSRVLNQTADRFKAMPNGIDKTALALQLFGRQGKALIPLLNLGSEGLREMAAEAKKFGLVLTADNLEALKKLKFAQRDLTAAFKGFEVQLGVKLIPVATFFTKTLGALAAVLDHLPPGLVALGVGATALAGIFVALLAVVASAKRNFNDLFRAQAKNAVAAQETAVTSGEAAVAVTAEGTAAARTTVEMEALAAAEVAAGEGGAVAASGSTAAAAGVGGLLGKLKPLVGRLAVLFALYRLGKEPTERLGTAHERTAERIESDTKAVREAIKAYKAGTLPLKQLTVGMKALAKNGDHASVALIKNAIAEKDGTAAANAAERAARRYASAKKDQAKADQDAEQATSEATQALEGSLQAQIDLNQALNDLVSRGAPLEFAEMLRSMGQDGLIAAEGLVSGSQANLDRVVALWRQSLPAVAKEVHTFAGLTGEEFTQWRKGIAENADLVEAGLDDLANTAHLSAGQILKAFRDQVKAERLAAANARIVFAALPKSLPVEEFKKRLAEMGPAKAAPILKALADALLTGNRKVFNEIVRNIVESDRLSKIWSNEVAPAATKLATRDLKALDDRLRSVGLKSNIRARIEAIVKDDPKIPLSELDALLKDLGLRKNLRTKVLAAVTASVKATVTSIRVPITVQEQFANQLERNIRAEGKTGGFISRATGGPIIHAGRPITPDGGVHILAHLGEWITRAEAVRVPGVRRLLEELNRVRSHRDLERIFARGMPRFATGGLVHVPRFQTGGLVRTQSAQKTSTTTIINNYDNRKDIDFAITNAQPKAAPDDIQRTLRNLVYLGVL